MCTKFYEILLGCMRGKKIHFLHSTGLTEDTQVFRRQQVLGLITRLATYWACDLANYFNSTPLKVYIKYLLSGRHFAHHWEHKENTVQVVSPSSPLWAPPCPLRKTPTSCDCCQVGRKTKYTIIFNIVTTQGKSLSLAWKPGIPGMRKGGVTSCIISLIFSVHFLLKPLGQRPAQHGRSGDHACRPPGTRVCRALLRTRTLTQRANAVAVCLREELSASRDVGQRIKAQDFQGALGKVPQTRPPDKVHSSHQLREARLHWLPCLLGFPFLSLSLLIPGSLP